MNIRAASEFAGEFGFGSHNNDCNKKAANLVINNKNPEQCTNQLTLFYWGRVKQHTLIGWNSCVANLGARLTYSVRSTWIPPNTRKC